MNNDLPLFLTRVFFCPLFLFLFLPLFGQKGERELLIREIFYTAQSEIVIINVYLSSLSLLLYSKQQADLYSNTKRASSSQKVNEYAEHVSLWGEQMFISRLVLFSLSLSLALGVDRNGVNRASTQKDKCAALGVGVVVQSLSRRRRQRRKTRTFQARARSRVSLLLWSSSSPSLLQQRPLAAQRRRLRIV